MRTTTTLTEGPMFVLAGLVLDIFGDVLPDEVATALGFAIAAVDAGQKGYDAVAELTDMMKAAHEAGTHLTDAQIAQLASKHSINYNVIEQSRARVDAKRAAALDAAEAASAKEKQAEPSGKGEKP